MTGTATTLTDNDFFTKARFSELVIKIFSGVGVLPNLAVYKAGSRITAPGRRGSSDATIAVVADSVEGTVYSVASAASGRIDAVLLIDAENGETYDLNELADESDVEYLSDEIPYLASLIDAARPAIPMLD